MNRLLIVMSLFVFSTSFFSQTIVIGNGASVTNGNGNDPIDGYYKYFKYQTVYTAAELSSAGLSAYNEITALGFSVSEDYGGGNLIGYTIKLGNTTASNSLNHINTTFQTVKAPFNYNPTVKAVGAFDMITFDSPFVWNGVDNIVLEICSSGPNPYVTPYGGVRVDNIVNGSRRFRDDYTSACNVDTSDPNNTRPQISFAYNMGTVPACTPPTGINVQTTSQTSAALSWTASGTETSWEYTLQPAGTGLPTGSGITSTSTNVSLTNLSPNTDYEIYVRGNCGANGFSTWVGPLSLYTGYCPSVPTSNDGAGITNIYLAGNSFLVNDVTYADLTSSVVNIHKGSMTPLDITFATNETYDTNIWIDYNDDLIFDSSELVFSGETIATTPTTLDASFFVPTNANSGIHRMRIGSADQGQATPNPCFSGPFGVTVDLSVQVVTPTTSEVDFATLSSVQSGGVSVSTVDGYSPFTIYTEGLETGVTDTTTGAVSTMEVWIGVSIYDTDPTTWTEWELASFSSDLAANDEYKFDASGLALGTYYIASRWRYDNGPYKYGAVNGFWDGSSHNNFELTVGPIVDNFCEDFDTALVGNSFSPTVPLGWKFIDEGFGYGYVTATDSQSAPNSFYLFNSSDTFGNHILVSPPTNGFITDGNHQVTFSAKTNSSGTQLTLGTISDPNDSSTFTAFSTVDISTAYSDFTVNIPVGTDQYIAFRHGQSGIFQAIYLDDVCVETAPTITWTGSPASWSNTVGPDSTSNAVIDENYNGASFEAKNLTINPNKTLTIIANNSVKAYGNVVNEGNIVVESDGNFIQAEDSNYSGTGTFTLQRATAGPAGKYTGWSSPVIDQNMYGIYGTFTPQYVMKYNTDTDYYNVQANPATSITGLGYSVKIPATAAVASFNGVPNNGTIGLALDNTENANGNTYNLVGNPYPSNLSLTEFYNINSAEIGSTFYFWDPLAENASSTQTGAQATVVGWAYYNAETETWTPATSSTQLPTSENVIKPGQAFVISAVGNTALFLNYMRVDATPAAFFSKNTGSFNEGKFWLRLTTPSNAFNTLAITYGQGAQNTFDKTDSELNSIGSDAFYSIADTKKLAIQGRSDFVNTDIVPLGNKLFQDGNYSISLVDLSGIFVSGTSIILHDKYLGIYTDLKNGSYTFQGNAGEQLDRFEIVYQTQSALSTNEITKEGIDVYKDGSDYRVVSKDKINNIEIFDVSGRLLKTLEPEEKSTLLGITEKGVYVVKITTKSSSFVKKLVY